MPEGDSYTRAADEIRPLLEGKTIDAVDGGPAIRRRAQRLVGSTVKGVRTRGKHLLVDTSAGLTIHVALGMPGRVRAHRGSAPGRLRSKGEVRLAIATAEGTVTVESAPTVEVERTPVIDASLERLGPDVLDTAFDWEAYRERAGRAPDDMPVCDFLLDQRVMAGTGNEYKDSATAQYQGYYSVSDLLLDQRVVAGIGNEYKSEILHRERVHPGLPISGLDADARDALIHRARRLMLPNAHRRGDRNTTGLYGSGQQSWVYNRASKPCRRCRTAIVQAYIGQKQPRITYWCPQCQALPLPDTG